MRNDIIKMQQDPENYEYSAELNDFFVSYDEYSRDTLNGYYGKTAKFWMKYQKFIRQGQDLSC